MNDLSFDTLSRFAAEAIPHRAQGREQVTAGFALRAQSVTAEAKNKKRSDKKAKQRCKKQVGECAAGLTAVCNGDPTCLAFAQRCCPLLANCNATGFIDCIIL